MYSTVVIVPLIFGMAVCAPASTHLRTVRSFDGSQDSVPPVVKVVSGKNLTLTCRRVDAANQLIDDSIYWRRKRRRFKLGDTRHTNALIFAPVTVEYEGTYICFNSRDKIPVKSHVHLKLLNADEETKSERKYSRIRKKRDSDFDTLWNNLDDDHDRPQVVFTEHFPVQIFYVLGGGLIVFIAIYVLIRCCHDVTEPDSENGRPRTRTGRYRHMVNSGFSDHSNAPYSLQLADVNELSDVALGVFATRPSDETNHNGLSWNRTGVRIQEEQEHLDLPPTYADSTANSAASSTHNLHETSNDHVGSDRTDACGLPPSYEEAINATSTSTCHDQGGGNSSLHDTGGDGGDTSFSCTSGGDDTL